MISNNYSTSEILGLDFHKIAASTDASNFIKKTANYIIENPYSNVGRFLCSLDKTELDYLRNVSDLCDQGDQEAQYEITMIEEMLSRAEGTYEINVDQKLLQITMFQTCISITTLDRMGLVKAYYDNMSLGTDVERVIAEKIE
jgi:hypothetical protein